MNLRPLGTVCRAYFAIVTVSMLFGPSVMGFADQTNPTKPVVSPKPKTSAPKSSVPAKPTAGPSAGGSLKPTAVQPAQKTQRSEISTRPTVKETRATAKNSPVITKNHNGTVVDIHDPKRGMDIHHGLDGSRRISVQRSDGSRLVTERGHAGYVQRNYSFHGHDFVRRSYYFHGRQYDHFYRDYVYRGVYLNVYAPGYYYPPAFYGWAYYPWGVPIAYDWGWSGSAWFDFYRGFFTPFAVYPSPAFWLTDYLIATDLQAAYTAEEAQPSGVPAALNQREGSPGNEGNVSTWAWNGQQYEMTFKGSHCGNLSVVRWDDDGVVLSRADFNGFKATYVGRFQNPGTIVGSVTWYPPGHAPGVGTWTATFTPVAQPYPGNLAGSSPLTPEVKQLIAEEVRNQLALENSEASQTAQKQDVDPGSSGIARLLADGHPHIFVVGDGLDVTDVSSGQECHLSDSDALQLVTRPAESATSANLVVKASKGGVECHTGSTVSIGLTDLQEMQNHMREMIDQGLQELQAKQGNGGLQSEPTSAQGNPTQTQYAAIAPPPDPRDESDLKTQIQQADQAESEVMSNN